MRWRAKRPGLGTIGCVDRSRGARYSDGQHDSGTASVDKSRRNGDLDKYGRYTVLDGCASWRLGHGEHLVE
jgi:hypothetical protein